MPLNLRLLVLAKIKRSKTLIIRYHNCVSTFHPIIKLLQQIELNPGPNQGASKRQANSTPLTCIPVLGTRCRGSQLSVNLALRIVSTTEVRSVTLSYQILRKKCKNVKLKFYMYYFIRIYIVFILKKNIWYLMTERFLKKKKRM